MATGNLTSFAWLSGTSVEIIAGVFAVSLTGWTRIDPLLALVVAANILWTGAQLLRRSLLGLMDAALPAADQNAVKDVLSQYERRGIRHHALRTRRSGTRSFISLHVLVPGAWTVQRGHEVLEDVERDIRAAVPGSSVSTHLEAADDPASWADIELDRSDTDSGAKSD